MTYSERKARRDEFFLASKKDRLAEALLAVDRLLAVQTCTKREKLAAMKEVQARAKSCADTIQRSIDYQDAQ